MESMHIHTPVQCAVKDRNEEDRAKIVEIKTTRE